LKKIALESPIGADGSQYENSVLLDTPVGTNPMVPANLQEPRFGFNGSFAQFQGKYGTDLTQYMAAWGIDTNAHAVWAVLDHHSTFAAVAPEPSACLIALTALAGGAFFRLCRRR